MVKTTVMDIVHHQQHGPSPCCPRPLFRLRPQQQLQLPLVWHLLALLLFLHTIVQPVLCMLLWQIPKQNQVLMQGTPIQSPLFLLLHLAAWETQ